MNKDELPIETAVREYRKMNPLFKPPKTSKQPSVLALTAEIQPVLIEQFGGLVPYWENMLIGVERWFKVTKDSLKYKNFRSRFNIMCAMSTTGDSELIDGVKKLYASFKELDNA